MARYLSPEWFEELNAVAQERRGPALDQQSQVCLQQEVTGGPDGDVRYWIRLQGGTVAAGLGEAESPDAVISQSYETAVGVASGEVRVQTALMSGQIAITGNVATLVDHQEALRGLDAAFMDLRARTSYR